MPKPTPGFVYFLGCLEYPAHVKVGFSEDPTFRLKVINAASSLAPLRFNYFLLRTFAGTMRNEREAHTRLDLRRIHHEWFYICPAMQQTIEAAPTLDAIVDCLCNDCKGFMCL